MSPNSDGVCYLLPFSPSFRKVLKGFLERSFCSASTVPHISLRQSSSPIHPPGVASHFTALWTISRSSPCTVHLRHRYFLFHAAHQTLYFLLWKCLLKLKPSLTDLYSHLQLEMRGQVKASSALSHAGKAGDGAQVSWPAQSLHPYTAGQG